MSTVAIIGAGISGLHLGLYLQKEGVPTALYVDKTAQQMRDARLPNNVCRFSHTVDRERGLGVNHWNFPDYGVFSTHVRVHTPADPIAFRGHLSSPASVVDFRIYLPQLLADYESRGGEVIHAPVNAELLERTAEVYDVTVVAVGGRDLSQLFPRDAARSADKPQRSILVGMFHGVEQPDPMGLAFDIVPGVGEVFLSPAYSLAGRVTGLMVEALPGGPWQEAVEEKYYNDLDRCAAVVLDLLRQCGSEAVDRIDPARFALTGPLDLLQGALTPTVRRPWSTLSNGHVVIAVGDAAVLNDPLTGQGANLASASAWELGRLITQATVFDESFCRSWEDALDQLAQPVTDWTNLMLNPPPQHVIDLFLAADKDQDVANAFVDNFNNPGALWRSVATPEATAEFINSSRS